MVNKTVKSNTVKASEGGYKVTNSNSSEETHNGVQQPPSGEVQQHAADEAQPLLSEAQQHLDDTKSITIKPRKGNWSESAIKILKERYLMKHQDGTFAEGPDQLCWRVAKAVAQAERVWYKKAIESGKTPTATEDAFVNGIAIEFLEMLQSRKFLPNSPTLMNAGKGNNLLMSACFVLEIQDSLESIFTTLKHAALIHQAGGGCLKKGALVATKKRGHIPIEDVVVGDTVYSLNTITNETVEARVIQTHVYDVQEAYEVTLQDGRKLTTSAWHPFMTYNSSDIVEKRADEITLDDYVMVPSPQVVISSAGTIDPHRTVSIGANAGNKITVVGAENSLRVSSIRQVEGGNDFYDLTVAGYATYAAGENGLMFVHNTGFSFSELRPKGSRVNSTMGVSSGPISFLKIYNAATEQIKQGGTRRGANMATLRVDHPDIMEFIDCKRPDPVTGLRDITNFNVSVCITQKFMDALDGRGLPEEGQGPATRVLDTGEALVVNEDYWFELVNPHDEKVVGRLCAPEVMEAICQAAWATGDPGLLFIDRANQSASNPIPEIEQLASVNPCFAQGTLIAVHGKGLVPVEEVKVGDVVATHQGLNPVVAWYDQGVKATLTIRTKKGYSIQVTPNHKFLVGNNLETKEAKDLRVGDLIPLHPVGLNCFAEGGNRSRSRILGRLYGDGWNSTKGAGITFGGDEVAAEEFASSLRELIPDGTFNVHCYDKVRSGVGQYRLDVATKTFKALVAEAKEKVHLLNQLPFNDVLGFLEGWFLSDGHIERAGGMTGIAWTTVKKSHADALQLALIGMGVRSNIYTAKRKGHPSDEKYGFKAGGKWYRVQVSSDARKVLCDYSETFREAAGNVETYKGRNYSEVVAIETAEEANVYDITVANDHTVSANGLGVRQCGEQFLGSNDACNLGSINLGACVIRNETPDSLGRKYQYEVDWQELERITRLSTRFLDDVIEVNPLPLPQIHHTVRSNRRIGLGIMGWADLLFLLGIPYHSSAARFLGEKLMQQITDWSVLESQKLAKIRGPFPNFNRSIYRDGEPLRNGTCTTVAPTGTISIIAGCSSGIEPVFALGFRHTVSNPDGSVRTLNIINSTFIDIAKEEGFYSLELEDWIVTNEALTGFNEWIEKEYAEVSEKRRPTVAVPSVPQWALEVFVNAHEVSTKDHVLTQASFQRGVHNGISKSVNMSHDSTVGDVTEAYMLAWNTGCKGITVFRDGCLATGQVLNVGKAVEPIASTKDQVVPSDLTIVPAELPPTVKELPKIMSGLTFNVNSPQGKVHVTINSDHEGPAEIFVNVGRAGSDVTGLAEGMGRLISYQLRTPSPLTPLSRLEDMRDQLDGIGGSNSVGFGAERVVSLPDAVAHALTSYLDLNSTETVSSTIPGTLLGTPTEIAPTEMSLKLEGVGKPLAITSGRYSANGAGRSRPTNNLCPSCGSSSAFVRESGCQTCHACGFSMC